MAENPPAGSPRVVARLAYNDVASALEFLENAYGFAEREGTRIEMADGSVVLVEINVVDSYIMIGSAGAHDIDAPGNVGGITQALIVYVDDIDRHYEKAKNAGAKIVSEPADQFWGDRRYESRDSEGHHWSFHVHLRDVPLEEMKAAMEALLAADTSPA